MKTVVLISTYELGHQPFGLASPAAWLKEAGAQVICLDLAVQTLDEDAVRSANLIAFHLPMHTATRIAVPIINRVKTLNPHAHTCCYGLYAPANETLLRSLGVDTILGGEFETGLAGLYKGLDSTSQAAPQAEPIISLAKQSFRVPNRDGLPRLEQYARLCMSDGRERIGGYTEASRGCKHLCRHCPIVPVYNGRFRIIEREVVLEDIRQQVATGAQHITFGDPDFFNGPGHAIPIVEALHAEFPDLTYDVTIKIEHLIKHAELLSTLHETGCLFVTSAVESVDDRVLEFFDKRHTRDDFIQVATMFRQIGLTFNPTFVTFTPWTTIESYLDLLNLIDELDLIDHVAPIQYAIRLLIPAGSKLLELSKVQDLIEAFDESALCYRWSHPDSRMDRLYEKVLAFVQGGGDDRRAAYAQVRRLVSSELQDAPAWIAPPVERWRAPVPRLSEPWFC